jgi:putative MATE family efflux protein
MPDSASNPFDRSIVEGSVSRAVWKLAWPTALMNLVTGFQGLVDHALVGHFVGYQGNAAVGVSWQIFLVVIVFISSVFSGMSVLAARYAGANDPRRVNRVVYQAFLIAMLLSLGVFAPLGYVFAPDLLALVKAAPAVQKEALPYLRIMLVFSFGKLQFFMFCGALRCVGDARTPLRLGIAMTVLNLTLSAVLIPGIGPIPRLGTTGAAIGTVAASGLVAVIGFLMLCYGRLPIRFSRKMRLGPDPMVVRELFRFGLPTGCQGVAVNAAGVVLLRYVGSLPNSAAAHAAFSICYNQLFALISWTAVGLMTAASAVAGQNLGAERPDRTRLAPAAASRMGLVLALVLGLVFAFLADPMLAAFGVDDPHVLALSRELLRYLAVGGFFITTALSYTGALSGVGATRTTLVISVISQILLPLGMCAAVASTRALAPRDIWMAILAGLILRAALSYWQFRLGRWQHITVYVD